MKVLELHFSDTSSLFSPLSKIPYSFLLDSSAFHKSLGRFSFFGALPYKLVSTLLELDHEINEIHPLLPKIPKELSEFPFLGGAVGFLSYDAVRLWEKHLPEKKKEPFELPDILFGFYDTFVAIDHLKRKIFLISLELMSQSKNTFETLKEILLSSAAQPHSPAHTQTPLFEESSLPETVHSNLSQDQYIQMVVEAKKAIEDGEIYQVNLSQCLWVSLPQEPFEIYQRLRHLNPACFCAYFNAPDYQILSSSPERFISVTSNGIIETQPIKGTIRRGKTVAEDRRLKKQLLSSEKDLAELMMIVDLERNDLGKICEYGSIKVPTLTTLRSFSTVHHLVSVICGKLRTKNLEFIIQACFPGGSITGAPKLKSMQIIDALEPHNRGVYTGSLGYVDYRRQIDFNIAIRTIVHQYGIFYFPVGGGIVSDSQPKA